MTKKPIDKCEHVSFRINNPAVAAMLAERVNASGQSANLFRATSLLKR